MQKFIFTWNDGKRVVIKAENLLSAQDELIKFLKSKGADPNLAFTARRTMEGDAKRVAEQENKALAGNIKAERQAVIDKEDQDRPLWETMARAALRFTNPFTTEAVENGNEDPQLSPQLDILNALSFGTMGAVNQGRQIATRTVKEATKKLLTSDPFIGNAMGVGADIAGQLNEYGELDPLRTGLTGTLSFLPQTGAKVKPVLEEGARRTAQNVILPSAITRKFGGLNYDQMFDERIFKGFGKYSGIEALKEKMQPLFAKMNEARQGGAVVDMQEVKREALRMVDSDKAFTATQRKAVRDQIERVFNDELETASRYLPEIREAVPNEQYHTAMTTAEREAKSRSTKANKKIDKLVENMRDAGKSEEYIAKVTGKTELDPIKDVGLEPMPYTTPSDFWSFAESKKLAETFDPWKVITTRPKMETFDIPLDDAMSRKTAMQKEGFNTTSDKALADAYRIGSGAMLEGIKQESPEAIDAMRQLRPYMAMLGEMERRKSIGGSNSLIPLKQIMVLNAGGLPATALSYIPSSLKGAQTMWDIAKVSPQLGQILGMSRPLTTMMDGNDEQDF